MDVLKAPSSAPNKYSKIFLAGTIDMGNSEDWQTKTEERLKEFHGLILNPRRDDWDSTWVQSIKDHNFRRQVEWELDGLDNADLIIMNFLPDSQSPITLLELGVCAAKYPNKLHVICPDEFWRSGNVQILCNRYRVKLWKDYDDYLDQLTSEGRWKPIIEEWIFNPKFDVSISPYATPPAERGINLNVGLT